MGYTDIASTPRRHGKPRCGENRTSGLGREMGETAAEQSLYGAPVSTPRIFRLDMNDRLVIEEAQAA